MTICKMLTKDADINQRLERDGYFVFRGFTQSADWDDAFACPQIHHGRIWEHILRSMETLGDRLEWDPVVSKFRASASCERKLSNATDAAQLHRDLACYRGMTSPPEIFTLVIYLNDTTMNVVPGSHATLKIPILKALSLRPKEITVNAGDAVLFWASLLHAGSFTADTSVERRVVQCFDIFPNREYLEKWNPRMLHLWCPDTKENELISQVASTIATAPLLQHIASAKHAVFTAGGYPIRERTLPPGVYILSGESYRKRIKTYDDFQVGNVYSPAPNMKIPDANPELNRLLRSQFYDTQSPVVVMVVAATLVVLLITRTVSNK